MPLPRALLTLLLLIACGCEATVTSVDEQEPAASKPAAEDYSQPIGIEPVGSEIVAEGVPPAKVPVTESPQVLTPEELAEGWIALFDGETLFGWKAHSKADWEVKDGAIRVTEGEKGLLCTTTPFDNYVLKVDFRAAKGTNSGVFLRTAPVVGPDDVTTKCYELNIAPQDNPFPTGSFVGRQKAKEVPEQADEWQTFEVTLDGGKAAVKLNGEEILTYGDPAPIGRGFIGLQLNSGAVEFKNIKLQPLGVTPIFNGKDLAGWKDHPDSKSTFKVTEAGELNVTSTGKGSLESEGQYGDFILQLECISHAKNLNSGIFFRCIPGEMMNGYESQIHNGIKNGDRTKPVDCGTGGIFRRIDARLVVPNDKEWFHKTLIAGGPHIAVWVNGYQVTDWTDDRQPHNNPRNGLRVEPGTLQIQGHDPTTNLSFRNIRARDLKQ